MKLVIDIPEEQINKSLEESKYIHEDEGEKGFVDIMLLYTNGKLDFVAVSRKTDFYSCKYKILQKGHGDLISRKDLLKELNKWDWQDAYLPIHFAELVADLPSAEKTAKWINETEETIECGNCHHIFDDFGLLNGDQEKFYEYPNFCPNCGRKMIGVEMKGVEK